MNVFQEAALIAGKDLRIETRARVISQQILPFGLIVLLLFAFALDPDRGVLQRVAPGLFWVTVLLAALLGVSRAFAIEAENGARDALRLSGLDGSAIFLGKATALALELLVFEALLTVGVVVLFDVRLGSLVPLILATVAATVGLAAAGTLWCRCCCCPSWPRCCWAQRVRGKRRSTACPATRGPGSRCSASSRCCLWESECWRSGHCWRNRDRPGADR
jgi:hypothetical protein